VKLTNWDLTTTFVCLGRRFEKQKKKQSNLGESSVDGQEA